MARIPDTELQRLKDGVSVQRLVEDSGIELKKAGKDMLGWPHRVCEVSCSV